MKKQGCLYWCTIGWIIWLLKSVFYSFPKWLIKKTEDILIRKGQTIDSGKHKKVSGIVIISYIIFLLIFMSAIIEGDSHDESEQMISRSVISEETSSESILPTILLTASPTIAVIESTPSPTPIATAEIKTASPTPYIKKYYITNTGSKYHEAGCSSLRDSQYEITLEDALAQGYEPCRRCKP